MVEEKPSPLQNRSDSCYMNAVIQVLATSKILIRKLEKPKNQIKIPNSKLNNFLDLLKSVNDPHSNADDNTNKLQLFIQSDINWEKTAQQDAFDILSRIINSIQKEIEKELKDIKMPLKVKLITKFKGIDITNKIHNYLGLSIGLFGDYGRYPGVTLEYLIEQYFMPTLFDEDPLKSSQVFFYKKAPKILLLHIQANKWEIEKQKMFKPKYYIIYDEKLSLELNIIKDENLYTQHVNYQLVGIIHHMGDISEGHYVAYRKLGENWFLANDTQIEKVQFDNKICPYILLYERDDCTRINMDNIG